MNDTLRIAGDLLCAGATTISFPNGFLFTNKRKADHTLMPIQNVVHNLNNAWSITDAANMQPILIANTTSRIAEGLTSDNDLRDRRFLTGLRTVDGSFGYCGGMDAVIHRALIYAQHADVVCYTASEFNPAEAERFSVEIYAAFPGKQLGFGYFPALRESQRNGIDPAGLEKKLRKLGYQCFFINQFGSTAFLSFPDAGPWAFFDDRAVLAGLTEADGSA
jgi:isocitrate lyase